MKEEFREAFSEIEQIINIMPSTLSNKIPTGFKHIITNEKSLTYIPKITEPIENCNLKEETTIILAIIYRDFLCSKEEKVKLVERDNTQLVEFEKELREKYNPDNIFNNREKNTENISSETAIVEYKERNFIQKIFDKIKHLFKRN